MGHYDGCCQSWGKKIGHYDWCCQSCGKNIGYYDGCCQSRVKQLATTTGVARLVVNKLATTTGVASLVEKKLGHYDGFCQSCGKNSKDLTKLSVRSLGREMLSVPNLQDRKIMGKTIFLKMAFFQCVECLLKKKFMNQRKRVQKTKLRSCVVLFFKYRYNTFKCPVPTWCQCYVWSQEFTVHC